jgi:hypothetical protein
LDTSLSKKLIARSVSAREFRALASSMAQRARDRSRWIDRVAASQKSSANETDRDVVARTVSIRSVTVGRTTMLSPAGSSRAVRSFLRKP